MTLFQHTLRQLLTGEKTETSRIVKEGSYERQIGLDVVRSTVDQRGKIDVTLWTVGKDYAIQPGRGQRSVGRFRVDAIWRQDVRTLTREQAEAERVGYCSPSNLGSEAKFNFLQLWAQMHDPSFAFRFDPSIVDYRIREGRRQDIVGWEQLQAIIAARPPERYMAWRLKIQVLWETVDWNAPAVVALQIPEKQLD